MEIQVREGTVLPMTPPGPRRARRLSLGDLVTTGSYNEQRFCLQFPPVRGTRDLGCLVYVEFAERGVVRLLLISTSLPGAEPKT